MVKFKPGYTGMSIYWFNNGGCQLCTKTISDFLANIDKTPFRGIRITKSNQHANCLMINGPNCLTQESNLNKEFSRVLDDSSLVLFGDCGSETNNVFSPVSSLGIFYSPDVQESIPITHRIKGCPPTYDEIYKFFESIMIKPEESSNKSDTEIEKPNEKAAEEKPVQDAKK